MRWGGAIGAMALLGGVALALPALAEDWQVASAAGKAFRLEGTSWVQVKPAETIAVGGTVKTLGSGTLTLTRKGVTVTISPNSRVQVAERMNGTFTDVIQTAGSTAVEVDPKRRIRLAVATPYMAAVVKGTVFTVSTFQGYSETTVQRGRVAVIDTRNRLEAEVTAGQVATAGPETPLQLSGAGTLDTPEPFKGKVVTRAADGTLTESVNGAGKTVTSRAGGNANGAGKSENSKAGGNAGGNGNGNSGNSNSSNSNSGGNGNSSSHSSGNSGSNNAGGNSNGAGNSGNSNAGGKSK
ncbi:FecR domain-containing protein [Pleomorphomonas sp. JP5]|uniref:FecR domain-containing protein n=1 Tax=Pleomorphomonas sp. JP5 TaxID=2942998 RepID=UPI0020434DFB|nr:FecR domain-containing protein [Pleomorphomonas sp. JP5]MCM5557021.1 FecR family protein [Pleomorphomonas sp. JP5]